MVNTGVDVYKKNNKSTKSTPKNAKTIHHTKTLLKGY